MKNFVLFPDPTRSMFSNISKGFRQDVRRESIKCFADYYNCPLTKAADFYDSLIEHVSKANFHNFLTVDISYSPILNSLFATIIACKDPFQPLTEPMLDTKSFELVTYDQLKASVS
jgi:hypothetical protein